MNTATHPYSPEEIMAFLDLELFGKEAVRLENHMRQCAECTALASQLRGTERALREWTVPPVPEQVGTAIAQALAGGTPAKTAKHAARSTQLSFWNWRLWAIGGSGAAMAILAVVAVGITLQWRARRIAPYVAPPMQAEQEAATRTRTDEAQLQTDKLDARSAGLTSAYAPAPSVAKQTAPASLPAPMIARTVSLGILVKDYAPARAALDAILARHHGYAAQLTLNTPQNDARTFSASLRVPSTELDATLNELRALGRVQSETQSGEEVTQQHSDLDARLRNARETEQRLRAILQQRTGKVEEVLDVEEKISEVRGEIEQMEAEQQALEHRVTFGSIDLQLTEEYRAALSGRALPASTRMHNAFVAGLERAWATVVALALFFMEFGPAMLIWLAIAAVPAWLMWRRYRRLLARI